MILFIVEILYLALKHKNNLLFKVYNYYDKMYFYLNVIFWPTQLFQCFQPFRGDREVIFKYNLMELLSSIYNMLNLGLDYLKLASTAF